MVYLLDGKLEMRDGMHSVDVKMTRRAIAAKMILKFFSISVLGTAGLSTSKMSMG